MEWARLLEKDKERLKSALADAPSQAALLKLLDDELAVLLIRFNEECRSDAARKTAAAMAQAARCCFPLLYAQTEPRAWRDISGRADPVSSASATSRLFAPLFGAGPVGSRKRTGRPG